MSTDVAIREQRRDIVEYIRHPKMQEQIKASLPPGLSLDRFTAVTVTALSHNPDLALADRQSLYNSIVKAAQDGLLPDGNEAFLNVYTTNIAPKGQPAKWIKKVQYQKMVYGIIKQFEKAGIDAWAESIHENDQFEVWGDDTGQHFIHKRVKLGAPKGPRVGVYAAAKRPGGRLMVIQVMDMEDLQKVRAASKSPDKGPWATWTDRMEQKSALHRLKKRVAAIDSEAAKELDKIDDEFEDDEKPPENVTSATAPPEQPTAATRSRALQSVVDQDEPPVDHDATGQDDPPPVEDDGPRPTDII